MQTPARCHGPGRAGPPPGRPPPPSPRSRRGLQLSTGIIIRLAFRLTTSLNLQVWSLEHPAWPSWPRARPAAAGRVRGRICQPRSPHLQKLQYCTQNCTIYANLCNICIYLPKLHNLNNYHLHKGLPVPLAQQNFAHHHDSVSFVQNICTFIAHISTKFCPVLLWFLLC